MIVLMIFVIGIFLMILLPPLLQIAQHQALASRQQAALQAASLAAARDLEKIIVNDPHFGYIALSDYPPFGKATIAPDGEPLPVLGINTVLGTARLEIIVANALDDAELCALAKVDADASRQAAKLLQDTLNKSLAPESPSLAKDLNGNIVKPYDHARQLYMENFPAAAGLKRIEIKDFHLSLGWLRNGSSTVTPVPQPDNLAQVPERARVKGNYQAFVDIPACGESFYFAGLGQQPALVDGKQFMPADGKRFCSILRVESKALLVSDRCKPQSQDAEVICGAACAQPSSLIDSCTPGVLVISFPDGCAPGIRSISDIFIDRQLNSNLVSVKTVADGDFPDDPKAHLVTNQDMGYSCTISRLFAQGFYDWLRTAHCRPRIDSVLQAVHSYFSEHARSGSGLQSYPMYVYEFDRAGNVVIINHRELPFLAQTIFENQVYALSFQAMTTGDLTWIMSYRNQVDKLGTVCGGKHAGQSMPGDPVDWCDLARYDGGVDQAIAERKGVALGITPASNAAGQGSDSSGIPLSTAQFSKVKGGNLSAQPRKNYYSGGLAVEFKLSSVKND
jgi:hypothetical protein